MADLKISQLTSATTPLAGTEVLPIVQSSATKQVSIANLTAGRSVSVADATLTTGNLTIGTSGKGIDFSATGQAGGMTSELLNDYEEGTWTPVIEGSTTTGTVTYNTRNARYTKIGRTVYIEAYIYWTSGTGTGDLIITGLPFTSANSNIYPPLSFVSNLLSFTSGYLPDCYINANSTTILFSQSGPGGGANVAIPYDISASVQISGCYTV